MAEQDLLERAKEEIRERLEELYPLVEERDRLRGALEALEAGEGPKRPSRQTSRQRGRPTTSRRAGRGERRTQLLELLQAEPGLRPSEAAWPSVPRRCTRLRGGSKRRECSSAETARCIRAVRRSIGPLGACFGASCGGLENRYGPDRSIEGSNPSLGAGRKVFAIGTVSSLWPSCAF